MAWYDLVGCYGVIENLEKISWFTTNRDYKIKNKNPLRTIWLKVKFICLFYLKIYNNNHDGGLVECRWCYKSSDLGKVCEEEEGIAWKL